MRVNKQKFENLVENKTWRGFYLPQAIHVYSQLGAIPNSLGLFFLAFIRLLSLSTVRTTKSRLTEEITPLQPFRCDLEKKA
jgi:hypothetical protein